MHFLMFWLVSALLFLIIFLGWQEARGGFAGFVLAVFIDFGLGGFGRAAGFFAAGWG
jgi:hypothetical protein